MTVADPAANDVPAKPASTVMLLRDVDDGVEVFMLRRTTAAAFAGGMYVFPAAKWTQSTATREVTRRT